MAVYYDLPNGERLQIRKDLSGKKIGMLLVVAPSGKGATGTVWKCLCDCGKIVERTSSNLLNVENKYPKNCGCLIEQSKTHEKKTRLHSIWSGMKDRCYRKGHPAYYRYGGRGIYVCDEWKNDFLSFKSWALSNGYSDSLTIDRIDNEKGYSPENCRWVDMKTQCNNTGRNHYLTLNGETKTMTEWSRETGIGYSAIKSRLKRGWSVKDALTMEVKST